MKNMKINYLVVGVDFSDYSQIVVSEAQELAKKMKVPIIYVHSYVDERWPENFKGELIKSLPEQVRATYDLDSKADVRTGFGNAAQFILETADNLVNPLIVIGHKGHNLVSRFFLGSTAEKIAQTSSYPVWIHRGEKVVFPKKVLVPSDFGRQTNRTINQIQSLSKDLVPNIELYHVSQEPIPLLDYSTWNYVYADIMAHEDKQFTQFKKNHPGFKIVREKGVDVADMIKRRARAFDVVAVSTNGKGKSIPFIGHVAARLIRSSEKPVLVCH